MRRHKLLKSIVFRLAVIYITLFIFTLLGANIAAYRMVVKFLDDRLNSSIMERYREITKAFDVGGIAGAAKMIKSHGPAIIGRETLYALRAQSGDLIAGNSQIEQVPLGFSSLEPNDQHGNDAHYKIYVGMLGSYRLTVGISYENNDALADIVRISFGTATVILIIIGLTGAAALAFRTRSRISSLVNVAHLIGDGELFRRLPISSHHDEIDLLSSEINVAIERLDSSVTALKQVTTDIAHDLKTPIARMFLMLDDVSSATSVDDMRIGLFSARSELQSISETFNALLRIAQIESRSRLSHFKKLELRHLAKEICDIYEIVANEDGYELLFTMDKDPQYISGDQNLIKQLIINLLVNSLNHTPTGSKITVNVFGSDTHVFLSVADNGPGIPKRERFRVFDRFYRLEKSRTTAGSGLGLSLVKAISELHGADITLSDNFPGLLVTLRFEMG